MLVKDWMSTDLITVDPDTSVMKASQILKENDIRRMPVMVEGKLVGLVTDRDLKEASPSKATTLDMHELYYLLSELKVNDIMAKRVLTIKETDTIERAAVIMLENRVTGLPVVDEDVHLAGMLSQGDIFRALISITGVYRGGVQFAFMLEDRPGSIKDVADVIRKHGAKMMSILTSYDNVEEGSRKVYIRIASMEPDKMGALRDELEQNFVVLYTAVDDLTDIDHK
ncbi:MAG: CBS and ACT domain-containing protein [Proteobacteria bacterium]|nr:CBS and ACT domain-containing protein [Pseudomonadota bacterium]MBU1741358.1 CBS and ACT domain-containing protein [Pseudomonadota bacterium]